MHFQSLRHTRIFPRHPLALAVLIACGTLPVTALHADSAPARQEAATHTYDIPAGPLATALNRFSDESGTYLVGNAQLTTGKNTRGLRGSYAVEQGFEALLADTGLEASRQANGSYALQTRAVELRAVNVRDTAVSTAESLAPAYAGGQVARGARLGMLGNRDTMDTPFNITSFTAQTIQDQQARSIADVLANDPSAQLSSARTNIGEDFALRGFPMASQDVALNGMYGLMPYFRVPVEMAERVEVLKGPSALLNGMPPSGNIGGGVNVVSKRAGAEPLTRVGFSYLSDSIFGTQVDIGRRFGETQEFGVRFNGAARGGDTNVDEQTLEEQVGALGLDYTGEQLRLSLDLIYQREDIDQVVRQFTAGARLTRVPHAPDNATNYPGYGYSVMKDKAWVMRGEYDFNEHVSAYAGYGDRVSKMDALAGNPSLDNNAGDFSSVPAWQVFEVNSHSAEAGLRTAFSTGSIEHEATLGATRVIQNADIYFLFSAFAPRSSNIYDPIYEDGPSTSGYSADVLKYTTAELTSYAVADTMSFFHRKLDVTVGARKQQVKAQNYQIGTGTTDGDQYDDSAVTPLVGVVYKPLQSVSLYANYIEGLSQGPSAPVGTDNSGEMFAPYKTKQKEVGVKSDWGQYTTTLSVFELKRPSGIISGNRFSLNGEQRNRGVEFNVFGAISNDVRLLGGGSYTKGELTKTDDGAFDGNDAVAVPKVQINIGGEWDTGFVPDLTLTARAIYTGKQYIDQANDLSIPDWTRIDIGARYKVSMFDKPVVLRANVDNLFDKDYWGASNYGYLYLGTPRTLQLSATVDF